jgi:hypothetical protein
VGFQEVRRDHLVEDVGGTAELLLVNTSLPSFPVRKTNLRLGRGAFKSDPSSPAHKAPNEESEHCCWY